ncbi:MAG: septum formation initiator family protein [Saprospiraceae bacterium]|nr:septum formation initiator family protein [Saprospiraceae bacterium]
MFSFLKDLRLGQLKYKRYLIVGGAFLIWMTFFDKGRWPVQLKLGNVVEKLEKEREDYRKNIVEAKEDQIDLENNLEKYAREKYYMHKPGEKVYIIDKVESE